VFWTREDEIGFDFYRPAFQHRMSAALNASGRIAAWRHRVSSTPISTFWEANADPAENEIGGAAFPPYEIENFRLEYTPAVSAIRRSWWRSVEEASSAFAVETFVDELAFAAGTDPLQYRLNHLSRDTEIANGPKPDTTPAFALAPARLKRVLEVCADASGWRKKISAGRARGVATYFSFNTYVAQVAEVSVQGGRPKVDRISCVVDCGRVINPDGVKAQMEGAIIYGLSAALFGEITIQNGRTRQSNFHDYPVLRMRDVPKIDVHLVDSSERPTGVGEPGVPPLAPAVGNALFALTGQRLRSLPFKLDRKT
jgi:CO/xanthine dehydrogenase Mo-binding subunit